MAMLSAIVEGGPRRMTDTLRPISDRLWLGTLCIVTLGALFGFAASAQQSHGPQSEAAPPAPVSPASPSRASPSQNVSRWQQALVARLDRFKRYPAQAHGAEGVASLAFTIDRKGKVLSSQIATSSGSAVLDAEALALVKRAAPFPPPPAEVAETDLSFVVPIRFSAGERR